jgi:hypothetical protein
MSATEKQGRLMDAGTIMRELGIKRNAADVLMRQLPKVEIRGLQKNFVLRVDVERYLEQNTKAA